MGKYSINFSVYFKFLIVMAIILFSTNTVIAVGNENASIAIVYSATDKFDGDFNEMAYYGIANASTDFPGISVSEKVPNSLSDISTDIIYYASLDTFDLIIGMGYRGVDGITTAATNYPDQNFLIIAGGFIDLPNVASVTFKDHEGSFLAGALAAMVSVNKHIAFLGGLNVSLINKFLVGFAQGARSIYPSTVVNVTYSPNSANPWGDFAGGKLLGEEVIKQGADVLYAVASNTGLGYLEAASDATTDGNLVYGIGADFYQDDLYPGVILTSMMRNFGGVVYTQISEIVAGTWMPGEIQYGLAENAVSLTPMEFTQTVVNTIFVTGVTRLEKLDELKQLIIDGDIVVDELIENFATDPVLDVTVPDVTSPADMEYILGETGNIVIWDIGDIYPLVYNITKDGSLFLADKAWSNGSISIDVDGLSIGVYEFTIHVYDTSENEGKDTVLITVNEDVTTVDDQTTSEVDEPTVDPLDYPNLMIPLTFLVAIVIFRKKKNSKSSN